MKWSSRTTSRRAAVRGRFGRRTLRCGLAALAWSAGGCTGRVAAAPHTSAEMLAVQPIDTLFTGSGPVIAQPIWIGRTRAGAYVITDASDRDLKVFGPHGASPRSVGGVGPRAGQFMTLLGGGPVGGDVFGYDFTTESVSLFDQAGRFERSVRLAGGRDPVPSSVRDAGDSLLLVLDFPVGHPTDDLLRLVRLDGTTRSSFFSGRRFYDPVIPDLVQYTHVVADAHDGIVFAGIFGGDSVYAFDYDGRVVGRGVIEASAGHPIPRYRDAIVRNKGRMLRADQTMATTGDTTLFAITTLDREHAIAQLVRADFRHRTRLDPTNGGLFVLLHCDARTGRITTSGRVRLDAGLLGRDRAGSALALRYLNDRFDAVEVSRLRVAPASN